MMVGLVILDGECYRFGLAVDHRGFVLESLEYSPAVHLCYISRGELFICNRFWHILYHNQLDTYFVLVSSSTFHFLLQSWT